MAEQTAERAELVRQKEQLLISQNEKKAAHRPSEGQGDFDEETTKSTGKPKSTVRRDKARGEAIPADAFARITGTELDTGR